MSKKKKKKKRDGLMKFTEWAAHSSAQCSHSEGTRALPISLVTEKFQE